MIIGLCCVKDSERWMERVLASHLKLCDRVLVLDDGSTDRTGEIALSFRGVHYWRQEGLPRNEARDRNWLFEKAHAFLPDWCWWFDGDETLWRGGMDDVEKIAPHINTVVTPLLAMWKDEAHYSPDWSVEKKHLFRYLPDVCRGYRWSGRGPFGIHCGARPRTPEYEATAHVLKCPALVELHWGWFDESLAGEKITRYAKWDPGFKDFAPYRKYEKRRPRQVKELPRYGA